MTLMVAASIYMSLFQTSGTVHAHSSIWLALTLNGTESLLVTPVLVLKMSFNTVLLCARFVYVVLGDEC